LLKQKSKPTAQRFKRVKRAIWQPEGAPPVKVADEEMKVDVINTRLNNFQDVTQSLKSSKRNKTPVTGF